MELVDFFGAVHLNVQKITHRILGRAGTAHSKRRLAVQDHPSLP